MDEQDLAQLAEWATMMRGNRSPQVAAAAAHVSRLVAEVRRLQAENQALRLAANGPG